MKKHTVTSRNNMIDFLHENKARGKKQIVPLITTHGTKYIKEMTYGPLYINTGKVFGDSGICESIDGYIINSISSPRNSNDFDEKMICQFILALFGELLYKKGMEEKKKALSNHLYMGFDISTFEYPMEMYSPKEIVKEFGYPPAPTIPLYDTMYKVYTTLNARWKYEKLNIQLVSKEYAIIRDGKGKLEMEIPIYLDGEVKVKVNGTYLFNSDLFKTKRNITLLEDGPGIPFSKLLMYDLIARPIVFDNEKKYYLEYL